MATRSRRPSGTETECKSGTMPPVNESPTCQTVTEAPDDATAHPVPPGPEGRAYWRSLDHLADTDEFRSFLHREFPAGASELLDSDERRHFLKIRGASMALAGLGLAGCRRWPQEEIVPFAHRPDNTTPGVPKTFASTLEIGGVGTPVLVKSYDGRPIKVDGNPDHPAGSRGVGRRVAQRGQSRRGLARVLFPDLLTNSLEPAATQLFRVERQGTDQ